MDSWFYGFPTRSPPPQPPPPQPPRQLPLPPPPPPLHQGIFPNQHGFQMQVQSPQFPNPIYNATLHYLGHPNLAIVNGFAPPHHDGFSSKVLSFNTEVVQPRYEESLVISHNVGLVQESVKRRRLEPSTEGRKTRSCKCKKTECLKRYCECFAMNRHCGASCGCLDCKNNPEHEDNVFKRRKEIETHNPNAFASKINNDMQKGTGPTPPPSQRNRTGCNCKTSMCQTKHCPCFKANARCSNGCHCNSCRNSFNTEPGNSNGDTVNCVKQNLAVVAELMESDTDVTDVMDSVLVDQYRETLEGLLAAEETNGEAHQINRNDMNDPYSGTLEAIVFGRTSKTSSPTDTEEASNPTSTIL